MTATGELKCDCAALDASADHRNVLPAPASFDGSYKLQRIQCSL
jgi:hypothetical protein